MQRRAFLGKSAQLSIPTNEHYMPIIHTLGLSDSSGSVEVVYEVFEHAAISKRAILFSNMG